MLDSLTSKAITAAIGSNDGANNGFWRIQPRDDEGQWIEMGADVLFRFRTGDGNLVVATSKGVYVGPSGRPGFARVLIKEGDESGLTPGIYEVESRNLQQFKAIIPGVDSSSGEGSSRKDKFGRPVQTLEDAKLPTLKGLLERATPATPEDERLARGELSPEETAAEADGRAKSPIADLPAGFEAENPEETKKLLRESGIEPDDFDSTSAKPATPEAIGTEESSADSFEPASGRNAVNDVYLDSFDPEGPKTTLDELIDGPKGAPKTKTTRALNLDKGDRILGDDGEIYEIDSIDLEAGRMTLRGPDGKILAEIDPNDPEGKKLRPRRIPVKTDGEYKVVQGEKKPVKPERPRANPADPVDTVDTAEAPDIEPVSTADTTVPETPAEPESVPDVTESISPTVQEGPPADRIDDGGDIVHEPLTDDQRAEAIKKKVPAFITKLGRILEYFDNNGKRKQAADPFELLNSLAEAYPNAKFTPDGDALILDRRVDKDGRVFELRASNTGSKALVYSMSWTDPETGEVETLVHYDKRHSITSVFRKDNSSDALLARLLSVEPLKLGKNPRAIPGFGEASLRDRAEWYKQKQKMFTPAEIATFYGNGRGNIFHKQTGTLKNQEVLSIWEAYPDFMDDPSDPELRDVIAHGLLGVFGRLPMDAASHKAARKQLRLEFKKRFPEENARRMGAMITNASRIALNKTYDVTDPEVRANPYASKDRVTPIEPGQVVEYINNGQDKMNLVVTGYAPNVNVNPNSEGYDYDDYIYVKDVNGNIYRINSIKLRILKDQSKPLTEYKPNLRGKALRDRRRELGLYGVSGDSIINNPAAIDTIAAERDSPLPDIIDDLEPGQMLPDLNGDGMIGEIVSSRFVRNADGVEGISFTAVASDGSTKVVFYALGEEIPGKD